MTMVMVKMIKFLIVFSLLQLISCSIDTNLHIDGLFPPDIDHDWRFNWNAFPTKFPLSSKYIQRGEIVSLDPQKPSIKLEPERKTFMDLASMLPIPNAESLMAASGVAMLQNVASASMPNIPKMVSSFFNIKNMFNNNRPNQLLPLLRSRAYKVSPGKAENDQEMVFGKREVSQMKKRNVTRRFKRPIVVAPIEQNEVEKIKTVDKAVKKTNMTKSVLNQPLVSKELDSHERHTFVNSDFVGISSPVGYKSQQKPLETQGIRPQNILNGTKEETLSTKLPIKSRFLLKNPIETTVNSQKLHGNKNMFESAPVMEDKFFTTTLKDLFQAPSNRDETQKNSKIVIITDDDLNDSRKARTGRLRSRMPQSRPKPQALESRQPPKELPVYIEEQRQMTGMHPPPIQIPNIFMGQDEMKENEDKPKDIMSETKICEHRKPKKVTSKPTKNHQVHSSVMDIITNHAQEHNNVQQNNNWSNYHPMMPTKAPKPKKQKAIVSTASPVSYMEMTRDFDNDFSNNAHEQTSVYQNNNWSNSQAMMPPPQALKQKKQPQKAVISTSSPTSYMQMENEFNSWYPQNNDQWSPNTPPFKQLPLMYTQQSNMDMETGSGNTNPYYNSNNDDNDEDDEEEDEEEDEMEFPAESKKVVRLMMPEVKFPSPKVSQHQQFQLQQFHKKPTTNQYSGYPGALSNIENQRYPSPHMMLNDGLLFQRYNLLKEIEQMQATLFGGAQDEESETIMANPMSSQMLSHSPIISSPLISSPVQSIPSPPITNTGPVMFSGNHPSLGGTSMKSGSFSQKGKPMKLMKFRVL